jgi:hypothetical protein
MGGVFLAAATPGAQFAPSARGAAEGLDELHIPEAGAEAIEG